jgi:hypothetical protein
VATSQQPVAAGVAVAGAPPSRAIFSRGWARFVVPSFSDCFFIVLLVWLFLWIPNGWESLLADGDVGWHIRTGDWILDNHTVPTQDLFSFSKPGAPWFAWEWLSDVTFALLFRACGLKGIVLLAGVVIGLYSTIVLRHAFWRGSNAMVALPLVLLGVGSSMMHYLARPHIFTLLFLAVAMWMLDRDRKLQTRLVWLLIPLSVLWVNMHGGFFIFLACLGLLALGSAVEAWWQRTGWAAVRRYSLLFAGCAAASVVNPYGIQLHRHVAGYLSSDWIRNTIQEFKAPTFRGEGQFQFEALLIAGLLLAGLLLLKGRVSEALWIVFLAHSSLTSLRHAPLFAVVAIPLLASEISALWAGAVARLPRQSLRAIFHTLGADLGKLFRRTSVWIAATIAIVALAPLEWPADFPKTFFPAALITRNAERLQNGRVLTTDQWGDYLIFRFPPRQKVYVDGRSDFYGEQLGKEYLHLLQVASGWQAILNRRGFDTVLLPPEWPIVEVLRNSADWRIVDATDKAILFVRQHNNAAVPAAGHRPTNALVLKKTRTQPNENLQSGRSLCIGDRSNERG